MAEKDNNQVKEVKEVKEPHKGKQAKEDKSAQSIVRIAGKDVDGALPIIRALNKIKGINYTLSNALAKAIESNTSIKRTTSVSSLSEKDMGLIEEIIKNPDKFGVPKYFLNKQKSFDNGQDMHFVGNDLVFSTRQDINRKINNRTWVGYRHQYGQKVRGQHTRTTGRTGITVGVTKSKAVPGTASAAAPAAAPAQKPAAEKK